MATEKSPRSRFGPYATERQAIADARDVLDLPPGTGKWQDASVAKLRTVCAEAGLELGNYDALVLAGLVRQEPQVVQVIVGLISRAGAR